MDIKQLNDMCASGDEADKLEKEANRLYQQALSLFEQAKRLRGEQSRHWQSMINSMAKPSI